MQGPIDITALGHEWIAAWNARDLDRVLRLYAEDCEMTSPHIVGLDFDPSGTLRGKSKVRDYWAFGLPRLPDLHFELCYYQGIDYAIRAGLKHFEPGAQGEHKLARGFLPARTQSRHWLQHEGFRAAVRRALAHEREGMDAYAQELLEHSPYARP